MKYVVKNTDNGKYKKGRSSYTDDIQKARIYSRLCDAKNSVTRYDLGKVEYIPITLFQNIPADAIIEEIPAGTQPIFRPTWQDYFLGLAHIVSKRSCDAQTQHGCVITNQENKILGTGYNSFPHSMKDDVLPNTRPAKYPWMIHAEANACMNCELKPKNGIAYVTGESCLPCLQHMWQVGIKMVYQRKALGSIGLINDETRKNTNIFLSHTGMKIIPIDANLSWIKQACLTLP